jgi:predicted transcriptional regulator
LWLSGIKGQRKPLKLNGKVIGEFVCDEIIEAECGSYCLLPPAKTRVSILDLLNYADGKTIYGWHIPIKVDIYDEPKELSEFGLSKAPQSWCYVKE